MTLNERILYTATCNVAPWFHVEALGAPHASSIETHPLVEVSLTRPSDRAELRETKLTISTHRSRVVSRVRVVGLRSSPRRGADALFVRDQTKNKSYAGSDRTDV
jgi:hypothetical protein